MSWIDETFKGIHLDFHTPEFLNEAVKGFDPTQWMETFLRSGADFINLFAKCHHGNSYYDTQAGHKHRGLEQDMLGELVPRLKRAGVRVVAYYSTCTDDHAALAHPDWEQVGFDGRPLRFEEAGWHNVCFNAPYLDELMLPQLREITSSYDIDGYWLDMVLVMPDGCFCSHCRQRFEAAYGRPLEPGDGDHEAFRVGTLRRAIGAARDLVRSIRPEVLVTANGAGTIGDHFGLTTLCLRRGAGVTDYSAVEEQPGFHGDYYYVGYQSRYARRLNPLELIGVRFVNGWGDWTAKPMPQMKTEAAVMLSTHGRVTLGDQAYPDGTLDPHVYERMGAVFSFLEPRRPLVEGTRIETDTAVLFTDGLSPQLRAADAACRELHLQHDIVDEPQLEDLSAYRLLIAGEIGPIAGGSIERIVRFAESGGVVLITGRSATHNDLASLTGTEADGPLDFQVGYLPAGTLADPGLPLLVGSPPYRLTPRTAETIWPLQLPSCKQEPGKHVTHVHANPGPISGQPAATIRPHGRGQVILLGFDLFETYWHTNHWWLKSLVGALLERAGFEPLVKIEAAGTIHATLRRRGDECLLHLVAFHPSLATVGGYPAIEREGVLHDVSVSVRCAGTKATLEPDGVPIELDRTDGPYRRAVLPQIGIYDVLAIRE